MRNYQKCIAKGLLCYAGLELSVYSDDIDIKSASVDNKGRVLVEFATLEDLQAWNKSNRYIPGGDAFDVIRAHGFEISRAGLFDEQDYAACYDCGHIFDKDDMTDVGGELVCEDCLENNYSWCEHCEEWHHNDEMVTMHTDSDSAYDHPYEMCEDCADAIGRQCHSTGMWYHDDVMQEGADGEWYCDSEWEDRFTTCTICGEIIYQEDASYDDDGNPYCQSCWEQRHEDDIRSYHDNPSRVYLHVGSNDVGYLTDKFIGTEVETECGDFDERVEITKKYGEDEECIYQMHDSSLDDSGIECITQPMTKAYFDRFDFEGWMGELTDAGARSHDTEDCGLHVHLSREWMNTNDEDEQAILVGRMRQFIADNQSKVERFARRTANHWCEYTKSLYDSEKVSYDKDERLDKHKECGKKGGRYQSVNNQNYATIEFRIFKGTLNPVTYRASVEFCLRLVDYVTTHEEGTEKWEDFVSYKPLPDTMRDYMLRRSLLTNSAAV